MSNMGRSIYQILDDSFRPMASGDQRLKQLYEDCGWAEGPVWVPAGRYLLFSDIPSDQILRWDETTGCVSVHRCPAFHANGNTLDQMGRLLTCEQGSRSLTRTEHDGTRTVLADTYRGARLNSPNDVVVRSDGTVYFSDPDYGIVGDYEGHRAESELDGCHVYRLDPTGQLSLAADGFVKPNGLALSLDETQLYVSDTASGHIKVFDVAADGTLGATRVFTDDVTGKFDGLRLDRDGRIWAAGGDGVHCYDPAGRLIGKVEVPEPVANVEFGGQKRNILFICATRSLYSVRLPVTCAPPVYRARR